MNTYNPYQHIQAYLDGTLKGRDLEIFEQELLRNEQLQELIENPKLYEVLADEIINYNLQKQIQSVAKTVRAKKVEKPKISFYWMLTAACILVALGILLWPSSTTAFQDELYAKYYGAYMPDINRGISKENFEIEEDICDHAHSLLELKNIEEAKVIFLKGLNLPDKSCVEKSEFYLMLISLKQENSEDRDTMMFKILANPNHSFYTKTKMLQSDLNKYK